MSNECEDCYFSEDIKFGWWLTAFFLGAIFHAIVFCLIIKNKTMS